MNVRLVVLCLWVPVVVSAQTPSGESRTWTDVKGRQLTASFVASEGEGVRLRLGNQTEVVVALATLSAADQDWVRTNVRTMGESAQSSAGQGAEGYDGPAALKEWPSTVALEEKGNATVIEESDETKTYRYESDHYEFVCDSRIGVATVREFSKVFEATWLANCLLPLNIRPMPERLRTKFLARIFTEESDYLKEGGLPGSAGVYMSGKKALMLPLKSLGVKMVGKGVSIDYGSEDYRTLIHEITHQMMTHWLGRLSTWYTEGAAEYVELAEYRNGRFTFRQQDKRLEEHLNRYGGEFRLVPMSKLMTIEGGEWSSALVEGGAGDNYASALALTYFFYHVDGDGKGTHFFDYLRGLEKLARPTEEAIQAVEQEHLFRERSCDDIEEELRKFLRKAGVKVQDRE